MPKGRLQRIQDAVHGLMQFEGMETVVIDILRTPELQRLRRIRQLGFTHFVFPGAEHSRLVHSLGTAYLAIRFGRRLVSACQDFLIEKLSPGPASIRDLAVAALCHDLGHGPLSHAWEREIVSDDYDVRKWAQKLGLGSEVDNFAHAQWHELVGHGLVAWPEGQLHQLLESHDAGFSDRVRSLLRGEYYIPYLPRLLASDVDVDRADFLRRDTHQTGVAYGRYDLDWLISACTVGRTPEGALVVGFDRRKGLRVVEQFLIARRALYETVYFHRAVRSAEGMVALFLRRLKEVVRGTGPMAVSGFLKPYLSMISGEAIGQRDLLALDDFSLWVLIETVVNTKGIDDTLRDLGQRILSRDLFKFVPCRSEKIQEFLQKPGAHDQIYRAIQPFCRGKPSSYLVIDTGRFSMFQEEKRQMSYFVSNNRQAEPVRDHRELRVYWQEPNDFVRLFTLREAVDAVRRLILH